MDCCSLNDKKERKSALKNVCFGCGKTSNSVKYKTVLMMLKYPQTKIARLQQWYFCTNPVCDVVYFSNNPGSVFKKEDIRIKVGIKESKSPKLICYCFDITDKQIIDEIKTAGKTTIPDFISDKIKNKLCACDIKNPSGKCCLTTVNKIIPKE